MVLRLIESTDTQDVVSEIKQAGFNQATENEEQEDFESTFIDTEGLVPINYSLLFIIKFYTLG